MPLIKTVPVGGGGGDGVSDHDDLGNLNWAVAGHTIDADVDFAKYKAIAMCCDNGTSFPASPNTGQWFYRSDIDTLFFYEAAWKAIISFGAVTLYVDGTNGSDAVGKGYASGAGATATIQYAIDLIPPINGGNVTVNVAAGTYNEMVSISSKSYSGTYGITLEGQLTEIAVPSAVTSATATTLTKTGASWTVDAYKNKLCKVTKAGQSDVYIWIISNTADTLTVGGQFGVAIDSTWEFSILDEATIVSSNAYGFYISTQTNLTINNISCAASTTTGVSVTAQSSVVLNRSKITPGSTRRACNVSVFSTLSLLSCYLVATGSCHQFVTANFAGLYLYRSWVAHAGGTYETAVDLFKLSDGTIPSSLINGAPNGIVARLGSCLLCSNVTALKSYIKNCTTGITASLNGTGSNVTLQNYTSCTTNYTTSAGGEIT